MGVGAGRRGPDMAGWDQIVRIIRREWNVRRVRTDRRMPEVPGGTKESRLSRVTSQMTVSTKAPLTKSGCFAPQR